MDFGVGEGAHSLNTAELPTPKFTKKLTESSVYMYTFVCFYTNLGDTWWPHEAVEHQQLLCPHNKKLLILLMDTGTREQVANV